MPATKKKPTKRPAKRRPVGTVTTPDGPLDVDAFVSIKRDEREAHVVKLADGSYAFQTASWLLVNGRERVAHSLRFTEDTYVLLMEAMHLGALYFGLDIEERVRALANGKDELHFEYGGNGPFPSPPARPAGS